MAANRNLPARQSPAEASAQPEKACEGDDRSAPKEPTPPRAGRTGGLGTRAERPSEGTRSEPADKHPPGRGAKAPSAHQAPHSDERSSR